MKWIRNTALLLTYVCVFALMCGISHAGTTGVVDSKHDLSALGPAALTFATGQVCVFCHTPHSTSTDMRTGTYWDESSKNYVKTGDILLLWNRPLLVNSSQSFKMYTSSTMTNPNNDMVGAYSLMCMSCHDGISAINVLSSAPSDMIDETPADGYVDAMGGGPDQIGDLGNTVGINIGERVPGAGDPGYSDLRNDHPITVDYDAVRAADAAGFQPISGSGPYYVTSTKVRLFRHPSGNDYSVECPTCHDVHNEGDPNPPSGTYPFLTVTNYGSDICYSCHIK